MAIPSYQEFMLPILKLISDSRTYKVSELYEPLSTLFNLTDSDKAEAISGGVLLYTSRIGWAKTYLKQAGLITQPQRASIKISELGIDILKQNPIEITTTMLKQFPTFIEFINRTHKKDDVPRDYGKIELSDFADAKLTPNERIEVSFNEINTSLYDEVLQRVKAQSPRFFEKLVVDLMIKMGYGGALSGSGFVTQSSRDEGIDGIIKEDKLGLDKIYLQAKRWEGVVGSPEIDKFNGVLSKKGALKGVFITTSYFSKEALETASLPNMKIVLIDGIQLAKYMVEFNVGISVERLYELKRIDSDYFEE